jgi:hypothetical protein
MHMQYVMHIDDVVCGKVNTRGKNQMRAKYVCCSVPTTCRCATTKADSVCEEGK